MSLKSLLSLIDDKLETIFSHKEPDAAAMRAKVIEGIDRTNTQFLATEPARGRKWWKQNRSVVAFTPVLPGSLPLLINGKATNYIPAERFPDFLKNMKAAVEAGEFDKELTAVPGEAAKPSASPTVTDAPKKKRNIDPAVMAEANRKRAAAREAKKKAATKAA